MLIITNDQLSSISYDIIGLVTACTVYSARADKDIAANIKNIIGGEIITYKNLLEEAVNKATNELIIKAEKENANAIMGFRFQSVNITSGCAEVIAYGTAINIHK
ncbi:MAG: heavy metal-binding domain-containing protein [Candidatus Wallbacteria bacterium]